MILLTISNRYTTNKFSFHSYYFVLYNDNIFFRKNESEDLFMKSKIVIFFSILCMSGITGCSYNIKEQNLKEIQATADSHSNNIEVSIHTDNNTEVTIESIKHRPATETSQGDNYLNNLLADGSESTYEMQLYTKAPNQKSSVKIQYPVFSGNKAEKINAIIMEHVMEEAQLNPQYFSNPENIKLTVEYQSAVTLQNTKIISIVFWGTFDTDVSQFPTTVIFTLNIDLESLKLVSLTDLYKINGKFERTFFEKAFFPTNPVTSYNEETFTDMLKLQSSEYGTISPFTYADSMSFFLKPEGIVFSMPAMHATGGDHFEAELLYSDIQEYYLPKQIYWNE